MDNNIFEEGMAPKTEEQQMPEQKPAEEGKDFVGTVKDILAKGKVLAISLFEKAKTLPKKVWIAAGAAVVAIIAVIVVLSILGNTYKTPIQEAEKLLNSTSVDKVIDRAPSLLNGFGESELKKAIKILKKSDYYKDIKEDADDAFAELIEGLKDEYGSNYKIKIKVAEKEKLEKEDLKEFRDQLRQIGELSKQIDEMTSDDYEAMAETIGISKSQAKDLAKVVKSFAKECKSASVKDGYELDLVISITGSELDEPEETEMTVRVFKVDGRWVPDVFSLVEEIGIGAIMGMMGGLPAIG